MIPRLLRTVWHAAPLWRISLWLLIMVVSWLAFNPKPPAGATLGWDKLNHASAFAALAFCAARAHVGATGRIVAGLLAYGALIEVVQSMVPGRSGEVADLLADAVGLGAGLLLAQALGRLIQPR
ncbi:VanZ family protein [Ideonella sp. DXS22W]|uniref:VanZ family protein n=1 Tax=Pseudaquabacterium inlustre TaxID=2984192 RepID=A0ABU9CJS5_9BURK